MCISGSTCDPATVCPGSVWPGSVWPRNSVWHGSCLLNSHCVARIQRESPALNKPGSMWPGFSVLLRHCVAVSVAARLCVSWLSVSPADVNIAPADSVARLCVARLCVATTLSGMAHAVSWLSVAQNCESKRKPLAEKWLPKGVINVVLTSVWPRLCVCRHLCGPSLCGPAM